MSDQFINIGSNRMVGFQELQNLFVKIRAALSVAEPVLEKLVEVRNSSFWSTFPFLRRLRPPSETEELLGLVRDIRDRIGR